MSISIEVVHQAVLSARDRVMSAGIAPDEVDLVASVVAALELVGVGSGPGVTQSTPAGVPAFRETFAEWAAHFKLESNYDRFLAVAVYLREHKQVMEVNIEIIAEMFDKARWPKPKNLADTFAKAAQKRYFGEAEEVGNADG